MSECDPLNYSDVGGDSNDDDDSGNVDHLGIYHGNRNGLSFFPNLNKAMGFWSISRLSGPTCPGS